MDLTQIKGLGPARREKLESAGLETIDDLAEADVDQVSEDVGISTSLLSDFKSQAHDLVLLQDLDGVGPANLEKLVEADVRSLKDLRHREIDELQQATGISEDKLEDWRRQAGPKQAAETAKAKAGEAQEAARELGEKAKNELENARVVLKEGIADARVKLEDDVLAEVRILPIRAKDEADKALENVRGNVVLLREKADTALLRLEDSIYEGVPIFKEKLDEAKADAAEGVEEVRVRVQEIRDKRLKPKADSFKQKVKSLFGAD